MKITSLLITAFWLFAGVQLSAQNPTSRPGPITVCPAGEFSGHHHTPLPGWLEDKLHGTAEFKAAGSECGSINVTYNGFTPAAEAVFQEAVNIWEASLQTTVTIEVQANWTVLDEGVLGSAGPNTIWTGFTGAPNAHYYPSALADQLNGNDLDPGEPDINANFNSDFDWYLGTDGNPPNDQYDLLSVVLHELGHGLGFSSTKGYDEGEGSLGFDDIPYTYDTYLTLGPGGTSLLDISDPTDLGDAITSDNVYTDSPSAIDALGGLFPRHYAPSEYAGGSSISHWNEATFQPGNINSLMTPQIGPGEAILDPGPITLGLFEDIGWVLCEGSVNPCVAQDLTLEGPASICPGETTEVDVEVANTVPAEGGAGVRFTNNVDVNIILSGVSFPYSFDNDLNGVLSANDFDPFTGEFDLTTFVYSDTEDPGASICSESENPAVVNFLGDADPGCSGNPCIAEDLTLIGPASICPEQSSEIDLVAPNSIPAGGGQGIRFNNGDDVNIVLFAVSFPYSFDNDLNGVLSDNDFDPFVGEFELNTFVYTDPDDVQNSICDESDVFAVVNFLAENDPDCNVEVCVAENLELSGSDAICPGETTSVNIASPNGLPDGGGQGIRFNNGTDINITLSDVSFPYSFDNDLNGVLSANDFDPFEGSFELSTIVYSDPGDVTNTICSESSETITITFLTDADAPCTPEPCLDWQAPEPGAGWSNFNDDFGGAPCDPGSGCPVFEITGIEVWVGEAYALDNVQEGGTYTFGMCNGPGAGSWDPDFTILSPSNAVDAFGPGDGCSITWTASESGTYLIVINEAGNCGGENTINNGYPSITCEGDDVACPIECDAGELEADEGNNTLCPGLSASILNTAGLAGVAFPSEGGYRLRVEINGSTYFAETLDPQFGFVIDNDLFGVVSDAGDEPLVGAATLTAETFEDSGDPDGTICDSSEALNFEFLDEEDPDCLISVAEFIDSTGWEIFPNPSSDVVSIQFSATKAGSLALHLIDLQGRVIKSQNAAVARGSVNLELEVNDVAAGYYRILLSMDGSRDSKPLVVTSH